MNAWAAMSRKDHESFVKTEDWTVVRNATGGRVKHHDTYELVTPDGRTLRTHISRPANRDTYGPTLAQRILRDQLDVSADEFWACVREGLKPDRGGQITPEAEALPLEIVHMLINSAGYSESQVARMTRTEAIGALNTHWSQPPEA
jgi:hypothetical protein